MYAGDAARGPSQRSLPCRPLALLSPLCIRFRLDRWFPPVPGGPGSHPWGWVGAPSRIFAPQIGTRQQELQTTHPTPLPTWPPPRLPES
ncbi:hypothetical protein NDU88_004728 [Pleurodeles waltl]|uniref:Uncharacterized protein n=1 Tax=Pleurodeles waltl TaxID=8319 RepID=A0AAV7VJJ0_PLEWA|nr:hypothetical protein NDU88_004728 [Pleurodeles waltl]